MTWRRLLLISSLSWLLSGCVERGFRHYDPMGNCIARQDFVPAEEATGEKAYWDIWFSCHDANRLPFVLTTGDKRINKLTCFDETEFIAHENACHAK